MSLYEEGSTIRPILKAKIENMLESDMDQAIVRRLISLLNLLKAVAPTMKGEERKDLNVLYMTTSSIYSLYYNYTISINAARAQSSGNDETLELIDEQTEKFVMAMNEVSETFLTSLKDIISTEGSRGRATELFENTYDSLVEDIVHKFTM